MKHVVLYIVLGLIVIFCTSISAAEYTVVSSVEKSQINVSGELRSSKSSKIVPPKVKYTWQYTIKYLAPEGKPIKAGQPIVVFDAENISNKLRDTFSQLQRAKKEMERKLLQDEQSIEQKKIDLADAEMQLDKAKRKASIKDPTKSNNEQKKLQIELKQAQKRVDILSKIFKSLQQSQQASTVLEQTKVNRLQIRYDALKADIDKLTVKAIRDGFVLHLNKGDEKWKVGNTVWQNQQVVELADLDNMEIKATIDEPLARKVFLEQSVNIKLDAFPERIFSGTVIEIGNVFRHLSRSQPKVVFDAIVKIQEVDREIMRPGMNARLSLMLNDEKTGLFIPESYIHFKDNNSFVTVKTLLGTEQKTVVLGQLYTDKYLLIEGLNAGDIIIK
jgi:HlyD family secretion protein